jgi:hypothetical protein
MFLFFGLSDLLCSIISLSALGTDHSDLLQTPECNHEPFTALVLSQSYEIIDRINVETLDNIFLEYVCATGFACKVLPDTQEVAEALACGYDGRTFLPEGTKNPYMDGATPLHGFVEGDKRSTQESWAVCCAAHVVLEMGGSLMTANDKFETPIQIASQSDGIVFAFFMHCIAMQGIKDLRRTNNLSGGMNNEGPPTSSAESKDAATKAEVEELRQELRETKQQFGNILLLFGKVLGLQAQQTQYSQKTQTGVRDATRTHNVKQKEATEQNVAASMGERCDSNGGDDDEEENSEDSLLSSAGEEEDEVMMA